MKLKTSDRMEKRLVVTSVARHIDPSKNMSMRGLMRPRGPKRDKVKYSPGIGDNPIRNPKAQRGNHAGLQSVVTWWESSNFHVELHVRQGNHQFSLLPFFTSLPILCTIMIARRP
ncbi:hypothetical protein FRC03_005136 [Tulasnella sp. 419]|nr:hypothetical protein FRC03_005136 [Tulasnella sp. 419]